MGLPPLCQEISRVLYRAPRSERGELRRQVWMDDLEDVLRSVHVLEDLGAQVLEAHPSWQEARKKMRSRGRHQYLAAVSNRKQPRTSVQWWPEVVPIALIGVSGMKCHPHAKRRPSPHSSAASAI